MRKCAVVFVLTVLTSFSALAQPVIDGLVAWYPFNGNALDGSGNNLHGTVMGAQPTTDRFNDLNAAYEFDGISDFIQVNHNPLLNFDVNDDFTISVWVQALVPINNNFTADILTKWDDFPGGNNDPYPYTIRVNRTAPQGIIRMTRYDKNCGNFSELFSTRSIFDGNWHNLIYRKSGNKLEIYIDGVLNNSLADNAVCNVTNTNDLYIGRRGGTFNPAHYRGKIDDVAIYDRALSQCEINQVYTLNLNAGLVAHYPLNGNSFDISGNGNNGSNFGASYGTDRFGNANSAASFDGIDDHITAGNILNVANQNGISISAWFFPEPSVNSQINRFAGVSFGTKLDGELTLRVQRDDLRRFQGLIASGSPQSASGNSTSALFGTYNFSQWYHVVATYEDQRVRIYVNGQFISENSNTIGSGGVLSHIQSNASLWIGRAFNTFSNSKYYRGKLDDIRIYNRVINDCEILELFQPGSLTGSDTLVSTCMGDTLNFSSNLQNVQWTDLSGNFLENGPSLEYITQETETIFATGINGCGCLQSDTFRVQVKAAAGSNLDFQKCRSDTFLLTVPDNYTNPQWFRNGVPFSTGLDSFTVFDTTFSLYVLEATDTTGCKVIDSFSIAIGNPTASIFSMDSIICSTGIKNSTYILNANSFDNYEWNIVGGEIIEGGTNRTFATVNWTDLSNAALSVYQTSNSGCIGDSIDFPLSLDTGYSRVEVVSYLPTSNGIRISFSAGGREDDDYDFTLNSDLFELPIPDSVHLGFNTQPGRIYSMDIDTSLLKPKSPVFTEMINACGELVSSESHFLVNLKTEKQGNSGNIKLNWNPYQNWIGQDFEQEVWELSNYDSQELNEIQFTRIASTSDTVFLVPGNNDFERCFTVIITNRETGLQSRSDVECIRTSTDLFIPNVFTPNGDGLNDYFEIQNLDLYPQNRFTVFNRSGRKVFEENSYSGKWSGDDLPAGVYYYKLDLKVGSKSYKGFIHLMR